MKYKYNQLLFKKVKQSKLLVNFVFYREDKNLIIYDLDGIVSQCTPDVIIPATYDSLIDFYNMKINMLKKNCSNNKNRIKKYKFLYKDYFKKIQSQNIVINKLNKDIDNLYIVNSLTLDEEYNINKLYEKKEDETSIKNSYIANYQHFYRNFRVLVLTQHDLKEKISECKITIKRLLQEGIYEK